MKGLGLPQRGQENWAVDRLCSFAAGSHHARGTQGFSGLAGAQASPLIPASRILQQKCTCPYAASLWVGCAFVLLHLYSRTKTGKAASIQNIVSHHSRRKGGHHNHQPFCSKVAPVTSDTHMSLVEASQMVTLNTEGPGCRALPPHGEALQRRVP